LKLSKNEVYELTNNRSRGRPSKDIVNKEKQLSFYNDQVKYLRQNRRGRDSTRDNEGNVKNWQIKSIDDKHRKSIEGIFSLNPIYQSMQYKFKGKHVIVFDDNLSSGATLDDVCLTLQKLGVASIMPFTLGTIPATIYNPKDRYN
jgi:hypothetical protein